MSKQQLDEMKQFIQITEGLTTDRTRVEFAQPVAIKAVNLINARMQKYEQPNRAVLIDKNTIEIDVPAGIEVDIIDGVMDQLNDGMYGKSEPATVEAKSNDASSITLESLVNEILGGTETVMSEGPNLKHLADMYMDDEGHYDIDSMSDEIDNQVVLGPKKAAKKKADADLIDDKSIDKAMGKGHRKNKDLSINADIEDF